MPPRVPTVIDAMKALSGAAGMDVLEDAEVMAELIVDPSGMKGTVEVSS